MLPLPAYTLELILDSRVPWSMGQPATTNVVLRHHLTCEGAVVARAHQNARRLPTWTSGTILLEMRLLRAYLFFVVVDPKQIPNSVMHRVRLPLSTHRKMR
jgi:hypothetical protein